MSLLVGLLFLLVLPIYLIVHIWRHLPTPDPEAHENFLSLKEMEYALSISPTWLTEQLYLFSSYRKTKLRAYHRPLFYFFALGLVLVHSLVNFSLQLKMLIITLMLFIYSFYATFYPIYRCLSSSYLLAVGLWYLSANAFLGYMRAASYDSDSLVDTNLTNILFVMAILYIFLTVFMLIVFCIFKLQWPVNPKSLKTLAISYRFLLADLRNA